MIIHVSFMYLIFFTFFVFFFFNDTATTEIYTLSLHDALPILRAPQAGALSAPQSGSGRGNTGVGEIGASPIPNPYLRSEEHTSELQSQSNLVCRLLLEKKKKKKTNKILLNKNKHIY